MTIVHTLPLTQPSLNKPFHTAPSHRVAFLQSPSLRRAARSAALRPELCKRKLLVARTRREIDRYLKSAPRCVVFVELDSQALQPGALSVTQALAWLDKLHQCYPNLQSVAMSTKYDADSVISALCAGASGYLVQDTETGADQHIKDMLLGLDDHLQGHPPISAVAMPHLIKAVRASQQRTFFTDKKRFTNKKRQQPDSSIHPAISTTTSTTARINRSLSKLTKREVEVLNLAAKGFTSAEMAALLSLSVHTISTHTRRIYSKLEVNSRSAAVYEATRQGLLLELSAA